MTFHFAKHFTFETINKYILSNYFLITDDTAQNFNSTSLKYKNWSIKGKYKNY